MNQHQIGVDPALQDLLADGYMTEEDAKLEDLAQYIKTFSEEYRNQRSQLYDHKFQIYAAYAEALWTETAKSKDSERSKLVSPLTLSAIRTVGDELAETVMPNGSVGQLEGGPTANVQFGEARDEFRRRLDKDGLEESILACILTAATFGDCFAELIPENVDEYFVEEIPQPDGSVVVGSREVQRVRQKVYAWPPSSTLLDYNVLRAEDSQMIIFEETVPLHIVTQKMATGEYIPCNITVNTEEPNNNLEVNRGRQREGVLIQRCYGKMPRDLLNASKEGEDYRQKREQYTSGFIEGIVTLANGKVVAFAENPTMRKNRGVFHYKFEAVQGRLLGRGIPEAGEMMQRAFDGAIRAHMDSLAVTSTPVTVMDATRFPRGLNFAMYAGRSIPVHGDTTGALSRLDMGQTDPALLVTAQTFERLFAVATGAVDANMLPDMIQSAANEDAIMLVLANLVKRNRQRATAVQRKLIIPLLTEMYYRYVQFEPETFPTLPPKFEVVSTSGILERHLETKRRVSVASTLGPDSGMTLILVRQIIEMSSSRTREKDLAMIDAMIQQKQKGDPAQAQMAQTGMINAMTTIEKTKSETAVNYEKAAILQMERALMPRKMMAELTSALSKNIRDNSGPDEFEQRARVMELMLKEDEINGRKEESERNYEITKLQTVASGNVDPSVLDGLLNSTRDSRKATDELLQTLRSTMDSSNFDEEFDYDDNDRIVRRRRVPKNKEQ